MPNGTGFGLGRDDGHIAHRAERLRQCGDAGREISIVVRHQNSWHQQAMLSGPDAVISSPAMLQPCADVVYRRLGGNELVAIHVAANEAGSIGKAVRES